MYAVLNIYYIIIYYVVFCMPENFLPYSSLLREILVPMNILKVIYGFLLLRTLVEKFTMTPSSLYTSYWLNNKPLVNILLFIFRMKILHLPFLLRMFTISMCNQFIVIFIFSTTRYNILTTSLSIYLYGAKQPFYPATAAKNVN